MEAKKGLANKKIRKEETKELIIELFNDPFTKLSEVCNYRD